MGKQIRKGRTVTPRGTFPIRALMSFDSLFNVTLARREAKRAAH